MGTYHQWGYGCLVSYVNSHWDFSILTDHLVNSTLSWKQKQKQYVPNKSESRHGHQRWSQHQESIASFCSFHCFISSILGDIITKEDNLQNYQTHKDIWGITTAYCFLSKTEGYNVEVEQLPTQRNESREEILKIHQTTWTKRIKLWILFASNSDTCHLKR